MDGQNEKLSLWDVSEQAEKDFNIPTGLLRGLGMEESHGLNHWDEKGNLIRSGTGPTGAYQFTRATARQMGINRDNPIENTIGAAKYLRQNYESLKNSLDDDKEAWLAAAIAHNRGLGAVQGMIKNRRFEPSGVDSGNGGDTRAYASRIANNWADLHEKSGVKGLPTQTVTNVQPTSLPETNVGLEDVSLRFPTEENLSEYNLRFPVAPNVQEQADIDVVQNKTANIGTSDFSANPPINNALAQQLAGFTPQTLQDGSDLGANYQTYLKESNQADSGAARAGYNEILKQSQNAANQANQTVRESRTDAPEPPAIPVNGQILTQTPTVQAKNDEDVLSGGAGSVAIDLRQKPKGENPGKYILRTALTQIAPQYGITQAEIENYLSSGNAPAVDYYNNLNDEQYGRAIKSLESRKQNAQVNFVIRNQIVNDILNARAGDASALNSDLLNPNLRNELEYQSSVSPEGLKQDQQNAAYFRENTDFAKAKKAIETERMTDPFNQTPVTDAEVQKRIDRDAENKAQAEADIELWRSKFGDTVANGFAGYLGSTARVYRGLAGIVRPLSALGFSQPYEKLGDVAAASEAVDTEAFKDAGTLGKIYQTAVGLPTDLARLGLLSRLPGGAVVGFAADAGLQSAGRGESVGDIAKQTAKGAALGATFGAANKVGGIVESVAPAFSTVAKLGTVGAGTYAIERISGANHDEALQSALVNTVFDAAQAYGGKIFGKVGRVWNKGKASDIAVDDAGNVSLVKFDSDANPNRVDFELVLDPTDNVYKEAAEVGSPKRSGEAQKNDDFDATQAGNVPNNTPETVSPKLVAENPRRIKTARAEALEKLQTDARAQKTLKNLKDKGAVTIEELQKATRYNKQTVEDAVMTLYAAKQVEILPDNSVRFIGGETAVSQSKSLFERAGEIETAKEPIRLSESPIKGEIKPDILTPEKQQSNFKAPETVDNSIEAVQAQTESVYQNLPQQKQQEAKIEKPIAQVSYAERPNIAEKLDVFTERGRRAQIEPRVVDVSDLLTSLDENYPQKFQPRDRSRAASKAQISEIANKLNPAFLGDSPKASDGRPLVVPVEMPDGQTKYAVISGNGRTAGIREAYNLDNEGSKAYSEFVRSKGETDAQNPVYVGVMNPNEVDDFAEFAREANESATAQMSASEQAMSDAERLDASVLNLFVPSDDGAIHGAANRDFVREFLNRTTSVSERNRYIDSEGKLNQEGLTKVKNAIFAKAFAGSEMGAASVSRMAESTDSNIKNITNALLAKAGELSSYAEATKDNRRYKELNIAPDIARAMEKYSELKEQNTSLDEYIQQGTLFGADTSPLQTRVMQVFDFYKRRTKAIRGIIDNYIKAAEALGDPNQQNLFGAGEIPSKEELFEGAVRFYETEDTGEDEQVGLFSQNQGRENQPAPSVESNDDAQETEKQAITREQRLANTPVGDYGQISYHLRKTGFANNPAIVEMYGADANTVLDAIAQSVGKQRSSQLAPADWKTFLDANADKLPLESVKKIHDALSHNEDFNRKITNFTADARLSAILDEADTTKLFAALPLKTRSAIYRIGKDYDVTNEQIRKAYDRTVSQINAGEFARRGTDEKSESISVSEQSEKTEPQRTASKEIDAPHYSKSDDATARRLNLYARSRVPDSRLFSSAKIENDGGVLYTNPQATELIRRAIKKVRGNDDIFLGAYLPPSIAHDVATHLSLSKNTLPVVSRYAANQLVKTINSALDNDFKDLIVVSTSPSSPKGISQAVTEEKAHRADFRARKFQATIIEPFRDIDGYDKAVQNVRESGYENASDNAIHNEIIAKSNRDDAAEVLGITQQQVDAIQEEYVMQTLQNGVDIDTFRELYKNISKPADKLIGRAENAESRRNIEKTQPGRSRESGETFRRGGRSWQTRSQNRPTDFAAAAGNRLGEFNNSSQTAIERFVKNEIAYSKPYQPTDKIGKAVDKAYGVAMDVISVPKSLKSSFDLSAAGRQGWILTLTEPRLAKTAFADQLKSWVSEKRYEKFKHDLFLHPAAQLAEDAGLYLSTQIDSSSITDREEAFMSRLFADAPYFANKAAEKIRRGLTLPMRASERAYQTYLDSIRMATFVKLGKELQEFNRRKGQPDTLEQLEGLAHFINVATGRGDLGKLNDAAPVLNAAFFSARYWKSRLDLLNPAFYAKLPPGVRKAAMRKMAGFVAATTILLLLGKAAGADVSFDVDNPDFFKLRFGDYSYDLTGGLIQHLRFAARVALAMPDEDEREKIPRMIDRYTRSKYSPTLGVVRNSIEGKNFIGEETDLGQELLELPKPIMIQNFYEAGVEDGSIGVIKSLPDFFGIGTSRYKREER